MKKDLKIQIYKNIIQYLLESTDYSLKDIAHLINCSIKNIHTIYFKEYIPTHFASELELLKLYHFILELKAKKKIIEAYKLK